MAATWTHDAFDSPIKATTFAECVTSSGGHVASITYGPTTAPSLNGTRFAWLVFASFVEQFQLDECMRRWASPPVPISDP